MKKINIYILLMIAAGFLTSDSSAQGVEYDNIYRPMQLVKPKNIDGVDYVPFYIRAKKEVSFKDANFCLSNNSGGDLKLSYTRLKDIPINERNHEDINYIEEGYQIKLWAPKDPVKYKGWIMKHDLEKGVLELALSRIYTNKTIEEKRKEHEKEVESAPPNP